MIRLCQVITQISLTLTLTLTLTVTLTQANANSEPDIKRIKALSDAGCNIIIIDAQNGDNFQQVELIKIIKRDYPINPPQL
jgi:putative N-acetylmannosamine-6-phosphate epimerase